MTEPDLFMAERPRLLGVAYRMLGSLAEAEDIVQEAWLRWHHTQSERLINNAQAFLVQIVTRLCIDRYRAAQVRRESYSGPWLPEPLAPGQEDPAIQAASRQLLSIGILKVMENLSPLERAVFVLAEAFDYRAREIGEILDRSEASCRQLLRRARLRVNQEGRRKPVDDARHQQCLMSFLQAVVSGDQQALLESLSSEVTLVSDGGGKVVAASRPLHGKRAVSRFLLGIIRGARGYRTEFSTVNGTPALLLWHKARLDAVMTLELDHNGIFALYLMRNPDKLGGNTQGAANV